MIAIKFALLSVVLLAFVFCQTKGNADEGIIDIPAGKFADRPICWKQYYSFDDINKYLHYIQAKYPDLCNVITIGESAEGRPLNVLRISETEEDKNIIWINGGIHAREWVSPAASTYAIEQIVTRWHAQPQHIRDATWYILPVINPDGYEYSRNVDRKWRKSRRQTGTCFGVDLDRNFEPWGNYESSDNPCDDLYHGPNSFSEPESQALRDYMTSLKSNLKVFLAFHSPGQVLAYPFAYEKLESANKDQLQAAGELAVQNSLKVTGLKYDVVPAYQFGLASGEVADWVKTALDTEIVYTVLLRDKGQYGYLTPTDQILATSQEAFVMARTLSGVIAQQQ